VSALKLHHVASIALTVVYVSCLFFPEACWLRVSPDCVTAGVQDHCPKGLPSSCIQRRQVAAGTVKAVMPPDGPGSVVDQRTRLCCHSLISSHHSRVSAGFRRAKPNPGSRGPIDSIHVWTSHPHALSLPESEQTHSRHTAADTRVVTVSSKSRTPEPCADVHPEPCPM
jgi:hypothetical protein